MVLGWGSNWNKKRTVTGGSSWLSKVPRKDQKERVGDVQPRGRDHTDTCIWKACWAAQLGPLVAASLQTRPQILTLTLFPQTAPSKKAASLDDARAQMAQHLPGPPVPRGRLCVCSWGEARSVHPWCGRVHHQFPQPGKRSGAAGKEGTLTLEQFLARVLRASASLLG